MQYQPRGALIIDEDDTWVEREEIPLAWIQYWEEIYLEKKAAEVAGTNQ